MPIIDLPGIKISGIASCLPRQIERNIDHPFLSEEDKRYAINKIGIEKRHIAADGQTASDLCLHAAGHLLDGLQISPEEIGILIFISQTPDYLTPATAPILQSRLGLAKNSLAFDVNLGCSAYVYGLVLLASLIRNTGISKGLLLVGDKSSQFVSPHDRSAALLFSDAGSATLMEISKEEDLLCANLFSDGQGYESIMVPGGGGRRPFSENSLHLKEEGEGILRHELNLILKGLDIFQFTIKEVVPSIERLCRERSELFHPIDYYVFHQANKVVNDSLIRKLSLNHEQVPSSLRDFGNTSSASIPVTISHCLHNQLNAGDNLLLCGFGVGLSWGNILLKMREVYLPGIIYR